jgi:PBSX family phage terminase large subunit
MIYSKKQADVLLNANARWNILWGAARSGKTHVSYDLLLRRLVELPDGDRLMIGRTRQTVERNILGPMRRKLGAGAVSAENSRGIATIAGKPFYVTGADSREEAGKLQGLGLVYAYGDEITTWREEVFRMLSSRLSSPGAVFDGTCNPAGPTHWLKSTLLDKPGLDVRQWHFTLDDNPFLPLAFVESIKREYSGIFYERFVLGNWTRAEGAIYPAFAADPAPWLAEPVKPSGLTRLYIGVDFGGNRSNHAFAAVGFVRGQGLEVRDQGTGIVALRSVSLPATGVDADELVRVFARFAEGVARDYGEIDAVFCDSAEQTLIHTIRNRTGYAVYNSLKRPIVDRIRATSLLLSSGRLRIVRGENDALVSGLREAAWDDRNPDRRLDDGSSNVDILDAFEYAWEGEMAGLLAETGLDRNHYM